MGNAWFNNIVGGPEVNNLFICLNWANIACGAFIFLHGHYIHRMKFTTFRLFAEICALGGILTGALNLTCKKTRYISLNNIL